MSSAKLHAVIDRLVEDAIRRILPTVMNEVLVRTIANSGALSEDRARPPRQMRRKPGPKKRTKAQLIERRQARRTEPEVTRRPARPTDLKQLLDESAGAEFYGDPASSEYEVEIEGGDPIEPTRSAKETLNPALRALAEDIELPEDDDGDMWQPGEYDSAGSGPSQPPIKDVGRAAASLGIDFSRMAETIAKTSPAVRVDAADVRARAQFEGQRLKRLREQLNGGKLVE